MHGDAVGPGELEVQQIPFQVPGTEHHAGECGGDFLLHARGDDVVAIFCERVEMPAQKGEVTQAAAYCYAYKIVERLDGIDSFILHRHVDHPHEGGLWLGLRALTPAGGEARPKKRIYEAFRLADTAEWERAFEFALPVVGLKSWEEAR